MMPTMSSDGYSGKGTADRGGTAQGAGHAEQSAASGRLGARLRVLFWRNRPSAYSAVRATVNMDRQDEQDGIISITRGNGQEGIRSQGIAILVISI
jgi:hypothetical protein